MKVEHFYCYGSFGQDPKHKDRPYVDEEKVSAFLNNLKPDTTDIKVHIRSNGGSYDIGFNVYDLLVASGKNIETVVEGECHSISTVPLLAGSKRGILPSSKVGIHNPWLSGDNLDGLESDEVIEIGTDMKKAETKLLDFYASHTGTDKEILRKYMKEDKPFDAPTALELKFVTHIVEKKPVEVFAYMTPKNQNHNTMSKEIKSLSEKFDEKFNGLLDMLKGKSKPANIKAEGEIKAESFTTAEGATINIDGGLVAGSAVTDEAGAPMASATITLADGTTITTDETGMILTVEAAQPDPNQAAIDAAVAAATKALTDQVETLKAQNEEYAAVQAKMDKKFDLLAKEVTSSFQLKTGGTKLSAQASAKSGEITAEDIRAKKKEIADAKAARNN